MKSIKFFAALMAAAVTVASCDSLSLDNGDGAETNPGTGNGSGTEDTSEVRQVQSIQMSYVDNRKKDDTNYDDISYLQTFTYNDAGKCTNIKIDFEDAEENDLNCDITYLTNKLKMVITGYHEPLSYEIAMENGRAKSFSYSENRLMTFDYNSSGYISRITEWCPEHADLEGGCGYVAFKNENGLCTGAYFDVNPYSASSADKAQIWIESSWYPHRYPVKNTGINLNTHIINGAVQYDFNPWDVLNTIGCLGKVSDCLFERTYGFMDVAQSVLMPGPFTEPNKKYEYSYVTFKEKYTDYVVTFEFDEEDYPTGFSYTKVYEKYRVDYYYQTNNVQTKNGYEYTRSDNTYTKVGNDFSCPVTVKINY